MLFPFQHNDRLTSQSPSNPEILTQGWDAGTLLWRNAAQLRWGLGTRVPLGGDDEW